MQKIKAFWLGLSDTTRNHIISAVRVFSSSFVTVILVTLRTGGISWNWSFWIGLFSAAFSASLKALIENFAPQSLGGIKR